MDGGYGMLVRIYWRFGDLRVWTGDFVMMGLMRENDERIWPLEGSFIRRL